MGNNWQKARVVNESTPRNFSSSSKEADKSPLEMRTVWNARDRLSATGKTWNLRYRNFGDMPLAVLSND